MSDAHAHGGPAAETRLDSWEADLSTLLSPTQVRTRKGTHHSGFIIEVPWGTVSSINNKLQDTLFTTWVKTGSKQTGAPANSFTNSLFQ